MTKIAATAGAAAGIRAGLARSLALIWGIVCSMRTARILPAVWPRLARLKVLDLAVPLGFGALLCAIVPLRTGLVFGGDEGYELMKGLLVNRGFPLYSQTWSDQPPLHTALLHLLFHFWGPSAFAGRLLTVLFAMILVGSLYALVRDRSGRIAALISVGLLLSSSFTLLLSVSVMSELPAMALALAATWCWTRYAAGAGRPWLILSGILFACGMQLKLTTLMVAPALALEWFFLRRTPAPASGGMRRSVFKHRLSEPLIWGATVLVVFGSIFSLYYAKDTLSVFWATHFSNPPSDAFAALKPGFRPESLLAEVPLIPGLAGLILMALQRRRDGVFPATLLATAFAIHLWHKPFWYYYGLHFALPLSWLGGAGIVEWFRILLRPGGRISWPAKIRLACGSTAWVGIVSLVVTLAPLRINNAFAKLTGAPPAQNDPRVRALRSHSSDTKWVFSDPVIYAFWADLPVPPELAVVSSKRFWSGQIDDRIILNCLQRYRPDQILTAGGWNGDASINHYILENYRPDSKTGIYELVLRNRRPRSPGNAALEPPAEADGQASIARQ